MKREAPRPRIERLLPSLILRATDGEIGWVDDIYFDDEKWTMRYLVVDTGLSPTPIAGSRLKFSYRHEQFSASITTAATVMTGVAVFATTYLAVKSRRRPVVTGREDLLGAEGVILGDLQGDGWARGVWRAIASEERGTAEGRRARTRGERDGSDVDGGKTVNADWCQPPRTKHDSRLTKESKWT